MPFRGRPPAIPNMADCPKVPNVLPNVGNVLRRKRMKGKPPLHGY